MADEKDTLPSDAESSGLKPIDPKDREKPAPDDKKVDEDPSEQPS